MLCFKQQESKPSTFIRDLNNNLPNTTQITCHHLIFIASGSFNASCAKNKALRSIHPTLVFTHSLRPAVGLDHTWRHRTGRCLKLTAKLSAWRDERCGSSALSAPWRKPCSTRNPDCLKIWKKGKRFKVQRPERKGNRLKAQRPWGKGETQGSKTWGKKRFMT